MFESALRVGVIAALLALSTPAIADSCSELAKGTAVSAVSSAQFASLVKGLVPSPKGEFETTAAFEARIEKATRQMESRLAEVVVTKELLSTMYFVYDADASVMRYKEPSAISCSSSNQLCRYTIDVDISDPRTSEHNEIVFDKASAAQLFPSFAMDFEKASDFRQKGYNYSVSWIAVLRVKPPYLNGSMSGSGSRFFYINSIPVDVLCTSWSIKPNGI